MLLVDNLDQLEAERVQMWELFAQLLDFEADFVFTAKELSKQLEYSKAELNKLLFRLYTNKALLMHQKTSNGTLYSLNPNFLTGEV